MAVNGSALLTWSKASGILKEFACGIRELAQERFPGATRLSVTGPRGRPIEQPRRFPTMER